MVIGSLHRWTGSFLEKNPQNSTTLLYREGNWISVFFRSVRLFGGWDHCGLDQKKKFHRRAGIWTKLCGLNKRWSEENKESGGGGRCKDKH